MIIKELAIDFIEVISTSSETHSRSPLITLDPIMFTVKQDRCILLSRRDSDGINLYRRENSSVFTWLFDHSDS